MAGIGRFALAELRGVMRAKKSTLPLALLLWTLGLVLGGCTPSLADDPEEFVGNNKVQVGLLCMTDAMQAREKTIWAKLVVKYHPSMEMDWESSRMTFDQLKVMRHASGKPLLVSGWMTRSETMWIGANRSQANQKKPETVGTIGPFVLKYRDANGTPGEVKSKTCTVTIHD
jgi:hypothetical protein